MSAIIINAYASAFQVVQDRVSELEQRVKELEEENMALHLFDALGVCNDDDLDTLDYDEVEPVEQVEQVEQEECMALVVTVKVKKTKAEKLAKKQAKAEKKQAKAEKKAMKKAEKKAMKKAEKAKQKAVKNQTTPPTETPPTETPPTETPPTETPPTETPATKKPATKKPATKKPKKTPTFEHGFKVGDTFADGAVVITKLTACFVTFDEMSVMGNANKKRVRIQQDYTNNGWYFMAKCGKCPNIPPVPTATPEHVLLGVPATATPAEIKQAWHKMSLIHHPDKGGDAEMMQKVLEAYKKLKQMTQ